MNTLRISPSAYIDSLTLPELLVELVLAASRLVGTRVVQSSISPQHVCRECACRATDRMALTHTEDCPVGMVAHLLLAIAHREAEGVSTQPHRKEPSPQENRRSEPAETAVEERRPFLLQANEVERSDFPDGIAGDIHFLRARHPAPPSPAAGMEAIPLLPSLYGEPLTLSGEGEVLNRDGHVVVDPQGCTLAEPDDLHMMRRIVACVNHCMGVPTDELCRETERAAAGGAL